MSKWNKLSLSKPLVDEEAELTRETPEVKAKPKGRATVPPLMRPMSGGRVGELGKYDIDECGGI